MNGQSQSSDEITMRGIFERPEASFAVDPRLSEWILNDSANPLNQIVRAIPVKRPILYRN